MEDANQRALDRLAPIPSAGDKSVELHNVTEQPISPLDERVVSANPSADAAMSGALRNAKVSETGGGLMTTYPFSSHAPQEQSYYYVGGSGNWDEHSNYVNSNNLPILPQVMYNDSSMFYPPGYGFDSQMAYGPFSPLPGPLSPIMIDGQLFPPHQMHVAPPYYPPVSPGLPNVTSALPSADLLPSGSSNRDNIVDSTIFGPGSGYYLPFGSFGGGDISGNSGHGLYQFPVEFGSSESLRSYSNSGNAYPQPVGLLGSYEQNIAQGFGMMPNSSARQFSHGSSLQGSIGYHSDHNRFATDKVGKPERVRESANLSTDAFDMSSERNRGPRASKTKSNGSPKGASSSGIRDFVSTSGLPSNHLNSPEFITDYQHAKFFVIKSFSEDNIHKSIKYNVWASTPLGNRKLDAAYRETQEIEGICPIFLFFSVNASGQFCGVAEMVGPVDFENNADYWQQDRWSGQFPVKWHIIKDVPNSRFRHILLENNDNKPVTHSRDSQEVKLQQGIEMLKIFKSHDAETSLLDDFKFYDDREKSLMEWKTKHKVTALGNPTPMLATSSINQLSENLADTLHLDSKKHLSKTDSVLP